MDRCAHTRVTDRKMDDESLYRVLRDYIHEELKCSIVGRKVEGEAASGIPDFLGIKDKRGVSDNKVEAVAVKLDVMKPSLDDAIGEVLGYSLFAHRCYLAVFGADSTRSLSGEDVNLARKLGVGLVEVDAGKGKCREAVVSNYHEPLKPLGFENLKLLENYRCSICGRTIFHLDMRGRFEFDLDRAGVSGCKEPGSHVWICPSCLKQK